MAIINTKADDYLFYKYRVQEIYLLFPKKKYKLENERLNSLTIMDNYLENLYPIIKIDLALEQSIYNKIIKYKNEMKIKLNIRKYYRKNTESKKSKYMKHINEIFTLILNDAENTVDESAHKKEYPNGDEEELNSVQINMELFLFKGDLIASNTALMNVVLKDATVSGAIGYLLSKAGARNVIMGKPSNQTIYPELIIPPLKIAKALSYLDSFYGIYQTGSIIYFGWNRNYILPYCVQCGAVEAKESDIVTIIVPDIGSKYTDNICALKRYSDKTHPYVIADPNSFSPTNENVTEEILSPTDISLVNNETGEIDSSTLVSKDTRIQYGVNPYYKSIYNSMLKSNKSVISINFKDCDVGLFTPNKKYKFVFEDTSLTKKYKGIYHLVNCDTSYVKESKDLTAGVSAVFRRSVM